MGRIIVHKEWNHFLFALLSAYLPCCPAYCFIVYLVPLCQINKYRHRLEGDKVQRAGQWPLFCPSPTNWSLANRLAGSLARSGAGCPGPWPDCGASDCTTGRDFMIVSESDGKMFFISLVTYFSIDGNKWRTGNLLMLKETCTWVRIQNFYHCSCRSSKYREDFNSCLTFLLTLLCHHI